MKFNDEDEDCGWIIEDDDLQAGRVNECEIMGIEMRMAEDALVVLLAAEIVVPLAGYDGEEGQTIGLYVLCNDVFCYAADAENIPPIGFGTEGDKPFWDLWDAWVADRTWGHIQWVALSRGQRPLERYVEIMKRDGAWTPELEKLPER